MLSLKLNLVWSGIEIKTCDQATDSGYGFEWVWCGASAAIDREAFGKDKRKTKGINILPI